MSIWEGIIPAEVNELEAGVELLELPVSKAGAGPLGEDSMPLHAMSLPASKVYDGKPNSLNFKNFYYLAKVAD